MWVWIEDLKDYSLPVNHFTRGGTGVTNFDHTKLAQYSTAIKDFPYLWIEKKPFHTSRATGQYSLHTKGIVNLSDFWRVFESLEK